MGRIPWFNDLLVSQQSGSVARKTAQDHLCLDAGHCWELSFSYWARHGVKGEPVVSRLRGRLCRSSGGLTSSRGDAPAGMLSQGPLRYFILPRSFPYLNSSPGKFKLIPARGPAIFLAFAATHPRQQSFSTSLGLCILYHKSSWVPCCVSDTTPASQACPLAWLAQAYPSRVQGLDY